MSSTTCKQCGADNASDSRVCHQCKTILNVGSHVICSSCYHRNPLHLLNCVNCGMGLNEGQPSGEISPQDLLTTNAAGPLPSSSAEKDFRDTSWFQSDTSHEEETKKHQIWDLENSNEEGGQVLDEGDDINVESYGNGDVTRKNKIPTSKLEPAEPDEHSEDIDILSILDLQLDNEEVATTDAPRQLSKDQLTPTDWISELVPQDSELPTMADMLPEPTPMDPGIEAEAQADNVMDILFGDTDTLDPETVKSDPAAELTPATEEIQSEEPEVEFEKVDLDLAVDAPVAEPGAGSSERPSSEFEEFTMDSWLTDIMSDMPEDNELESEDEPSATVSEHEEMDELPDWLDFSDPAESEAAGQSEIDAAIAETFESLPSSSLVDDELVINENELSFSQAETESVEPALVNDLESPAESIEELEQEIFKAIVESDNEEKGSDKMTQDNNLDPWDDDSLNWLADDLEEVDDSVKAEPAQSSVTEPENHLQTRDLSQIDLPIDVEEGEDEHAAGAVQAELPNWIKEMAPDADNESVIIPDEDNYQMNDDALSEIISAMESELNLGQDEAGDENITEADDALSVEDHMPVFENDDSQIMETMISKHTEPLSRFDMTAPDLEEKSYFKSDSEEIDDIPALDFSEIDEAASADLKTDLEEEAQMPSEEQLLMEAISAIESEVDEIKESEPSPISGLGFDDESDLPEWLPPADESSYSAPELPPSTTDLPDWLRKPQVEDVAEPAELGFSEATVEEVHSLSADELTISPSDELDEIISQHTAEELIADNIDDLLVETDAPSLDSSPQIDDGLGDDLAQFDWDDIENDNSPVTEFDLSQKPDDDSAGSMFDSEPSDLLDELILESSESSADDEPLFEDEDELDENSDFDWLDGESIDNEFIDDGDFSGLVTEEESSAEPSFEESDHISDELDSVVASVDELEAEIEVEAPDLEMPDLDLLNEPEISIPEPSLEADLEETILSHDFEEPTLEEGVLEQDFEPAETEESESVMSELVVEQVEDDVDMSAWDEMEDAFSPLKEFDDETDVFSTIRDTPRIEETISAESLAGYISKPDWEIEPEADEELPESNDDFLSTFAEEAGDEVELPSWANELSSSSGADKTAEAVSGRSPLFGIDNIVDVAPVIANPVQDLANLHTPQMMEPVAHRKRAHLAAQAAGTVPMSDPTQPVVVPKARQRYQPRFNPNQFDGRPNQQKKKRSRQIGFIVVAAVIALMIGIAFASSYILSFFSG